MTAIGGNGQRTPGEAPRVLLVDDEADALTVCAAGLTAHGCVVTTCADSAKVLLLLRTRPMDAVVLDLRMPTLEGTDLLPLIKQQHPDLPVVIASAYCDEASARYCRELGACEVISKPFTQDALLAAIHRALREEEAIPLVLTTLSLADARDQVYRRLILAALRKTRWNQSRAAVHLGISRYGLLRWIKRLGLAETTSRRQAA